MISIGVSRIFSDVEHLFMRLLAISLSSLEKCLYRFFLCCVIGVHYILKKSTPLACIIWKYLLSFSSSVCLFILLLVSFVCKRILVSWSPICLFCSSFPCLRKRIQNDIAKTNVKKNTAYVFFQRFMASGLLLGPQSILSLFCI